MEIRNNSNMSFQARVSQPVKNEILDTALNYGSKAVKEAKRQIRNVESWGTNNSFVDLNYFDRATKTINLVKPFGLVLSNNNAKIADEVVLSAGKKTLFQNFMALTEKDVVAAEKQLNANTTSIDTFA